MWVQHGQRMAGRQPAAQPHCCAMLQRLMGNNCGPRLVAALGPAHAVVPCEKGYASRQRE